MSINTAQVTNVMQIFQFLDYVKGINCYFVFVCILLRRALYYQRRWVKLDVDYLRYFDSDKVTRQDISHCRTGHSYSLEVLKYAFLHTQT